MRCLSVAPNGNVTITWVAPGLPPYFDKYEIYHATNLAGPYTLLTTIPLAGTLSYTDPGTGANSAPQYYYMRMTGGCDAATVDTSVASITLATIYLTTTNPSPNTDPGIGTLNWTAQPLLPSTTGGIYITNSNYNAGGAWSSFGTGTAALTFNQDIRDCNIPLQHQITVVDNSGCVSQSNIAANNFTYLGNVVDNPDLRCLSVQANGNVRLDWITPATINTNFNEFEVWRDNGTGATLIDSVDVFAQTNYTDLTANANVGPISYYLISQSGCPFQ